MVETVVQIKFKKNKAIISIDAEIIRTANRPGNLLEMKIAIDEKSADTSKAAICRLQNWFKQWLKMNLHQELITDIVI